jgi:hypothetical protein
MKYPLWLTKIPHFDKWLHALGASFLYLTGRAMSGDPFFTFIGVLVLLGIKEWYDGKNPEKHTRDIWDFVAGFIPTVLLFVTDITLYWKG